MRAWRLMRCGLGIALGAAALYGCGGSGEQPWGMDPALVGAWDQIDLTEDGQPAYFDAKVMVFRDNGKWRSDTEDGSWSRGTYGTRNGLLRYSIKASDDPDNVGHTYTFDCDVAGNTMTISGKHQGHYYVATFARVTE